MTIVGLLPWIQMGLSIVLVVLVLIQQSDASLGSAFGGSTSEGVERSRRGVDKLIFQLTIIVAILFTISVLGGLFI